VDTVVLAPAGYLLDPDIGSDYERPWRLAQGLAKRGLRVVVVAREAKRMAELGPNVELSCPPGALPTTPTGRIIDRANLYWHARQVAHKEIAAGRALVVHHLGPCGEQSPSLIARIPIPFVYGPLPASRPSNHQDNDEWLSWLRTPGAGRANARLSAIAAQPARHVAHLLWLRTMRRADAITVEAAANVVDRNPNVVVIPPGIDEVQFSPHGQGLPVGGRVIAVGRLIGRKSYDLLIRAVALAIRSQRSVHLLLVGSGPEENALRLLASQLGVTAAVTFVGDVPRAQLPRLLQTAEIFCHPARWDNVPFAPLEAMACGLPTVVSNAGGLPDIVGDAGLVHVSGDVDSLAQAILRVLSSQSVRQALGEAARKRVVEHFTWQAMCDSYLKLYERLGENTRVNRSAELVP
jgi:glycosyltransferase involved in cell wall biosynthesis